LASIALILVCFEKELLLKVFDFLFGSLRFTDIDRGKFELSPPELEDLEEAVAEEG
jgi:hypothetical protein